MIHYLLLYFTSGDRIKKINFIENHFFFKLPLTNCVLFFAIYENEII